MLPLSPQRGREAENAKWPLLV